MTSSRSSLLGGLGFAAYSGANYVLDGFAETTGRGDHPKLSVAWDAWNVNPGRRHQFGNTPTHAAIDPYPGAQVFAQLLGAAAQGVVAVSVLPIETRLQRWVNPAPGTSARSETTPHDTRTGPTSGFVAGSIPAQVTAIWQEMLGLESVTTESNFFSLGGDSLIATHLMARLNRLCGANIPLSALFEHQTLGDLIRYIEAVRWAVGAKRPELAEIDETFEEGTL